MKANRFLATVAVLALAGSAIVVGAARSEHSGISAPQDHPASTPNDVDQQAVDVAAAPVSFVENRGQTDASVRYYAQGNRFAFYLTPAP